MNILSIDTATEACSAALLCNGEVAERYAVEPRGHARLILSMVDELMADAGITQPQLDAIAFGRGPGAFTGIRIAASVTQGLAVANDLPVLPVSDLAAMAWGAWRQSAAPLSITAIDARMGELYWAAWRCSTQGIEEIVDESLATPEGVVWPELNTAGADLLRWRALGTGWGTYGEVLAQNCPLLIERTDAEALPHAVDILELAVFDWQKGLAVDAAEAQPVYLRNNVAQVSKKPLL